jgi:hypothetical protein
MDIVNTFKVRSNVYIIQSNTCSISNREKELKKLFVSTDEYTTKSYEEIINDFKFNQQYTIIKPNTTLCDVILTGNFYDFSKIGIFNIIQEENYFKNIILSEKNTNEEIKSRLINFMAQYREDYKKQMTKLTETYTYQNYNNETRAYTTYYFDIIKEFRDIGFDFRYLMAFIDCIKDITSSDYEADYKDILITSYDNYNHNTLINTTSTKDEFLFDTISKIFYKIENIKKLKVVYLNNVNKFKLPESEILPNNNGFTYFQIFMIIFAELFLN